MYILSISTTCVAMHRYQIKDYTKEFTIGTINSRLTFYTKEAKKQILFIVF